MGLVLFSEEMLKMGFVPLLECGENPALQSKCHASGMKGLAGGGGNSETLGEVGLMKIERSCCRGAFVSESKPQLIFQPLEPLQQLLTTTGSSIERIGT